MTTQQCVEVKLELGHKAVLRPKPTPEGFTHDWKVYVRGPENCSIQHFVEKVVFHLHESFPKPKRVLKEPPYHVAECGYAGFNMPIEVHFRNKEEPKKVQFEYDLYLHLEGPPINNVRFEKLIFQNPTDEFRRKLLKSGGTISGVHSSSGASQQVKTETENHSQNTKASKGIIQVPKKTPKTKTTSKDVVQIPQAKVSHPFTDIFGTPIKRKPSPEPSFAKSKENAAQKLTPSKTINVLVAPCKESKHKEKEKHQHNKHSKSGKEHRNELKEPKNSSSKRPISPSSSDVQLHVEKRKRTASTSSSGASKASGEPSEKSDEIKEKRRGDKREEKVHKPRGRPPDSSKSSKEKSHKKEKKEGVIKLEKTVPLPLQIKDENSNASSLMLAEDIAPPKVKESQEEKPVKVEEDSSPGSSISLSPLVTGGSHGPLAAMMEEMEQGLLSPLSSDPSSPVAVAPVLEKNRQDTPPLIKNKVNSSSTPPSKGRPCTPPLPPVKEKPSNDVLSLKSRHSTKTPPPKNRTSDDTAPSKKENRGVNDLPPPKSKVTNDGLAPKSRVSTESPPPAKSKSSANATRTKNRSAVPDSPSSKVSRVQSSTPPPPPTTTPHSHKQKSLNDSTSAKIRSSNEAPSTKVRPHGDAIPQKSKSNTDTPPLAKSTMDGDCLTARNKSTNEVVKDSSSDVRYSKPPVDEEYLGELIELQKRIAALRDQNHLQRIVDVIEETGLYRVTDSTFDFDLCALDRSTVQKLQSCLAVK